MRHLGINLGLYLVRVNLTKNIEINWVLKHKFCFLIQSWWFVIYLFFTEIIRELRDASRIREETMMSRVKSMIEDQNSMKMQEIEQLKVFIIKFIIKNNVLTWLLNSRIEKESISQLHVFVTDKQKKIINS